MKETHLKTHFMTCRLVRNIIDVVKSYGIADHVHDHILDKVDKHFDQNGITRDTYQYLSRDSWVAS